MTDTSSEQKINVILDHDGSADDFIALFYLLALHKHEKINLMCTTIAATGEAHASPGAKNTALYCDYFSKKLIPIGYGTETPISKNFLPFPVGLRTTVDTIATDKGLGFFSERYFHNAIKLIHDKLAALKENEKAIIIATGPLTNIAELLSKYPDIKNKIEKIVIMGGALNIPGNIKVLHPKIINLDNERECNFAADPKAAHEVLHSGVPITLVPLDITNQIPMTMEFYNSLKSNNTNSMHHHMHLLLKEIYDKYGEKIFTEHFFLWDVFAAILAIHPDWATYIKADIIVHLEEKPGKTTFSNKENLSSAILVAMSLNNKKPEEILNYLKGTTSITPCATTSAGFTPLQQSHKKSDNFKTEFKRPEVPTIETTTQKRQAFAAKKLA